MKKRIIVIDNTEKRRESLCKLITNNIHEKKLSDKIQVKAFNQVWGNKEKKFPLNFVESGDINFLHANDSVNPLWDNFAKKKCQNKWVICFSGAGMHGLSWNNPKHFYESKTINSIEDIRTKWNISDFLNAIYNEEQPINALFRIDPLLEAKLLIWKHLNIQFNETPYNFEQAKEVVNEKIKPFIEDFKRELPLWYNYKEENKKFSKKGISDLYNELFDG